jgi:hypothetical protein
MADGREEQDRFLFEKIYLSHEAAMGAFPFGAW